MPTTQVVIETTPTLLGTRTGTAEVPATILVQNLGAVMQVADGNPGATEGAVLAAGALSAPGGVLRDSGPGSVSWYGWVATGTGLAAVTVLNE